MDAFIAFAIWVAFGIVIYFMYGYKYANLKEEPIPVIDDNISEEVALESITD